MYFGNSMGTQKKSFISVSFIMQLEVYLSLITFKYFNFRQNFICVFGPVCNIFIVSQISTLAPPLKIPQIL